MSIKKKRFHFFCVVMEVLIKNIEQNERKSIRLQKKWNFLKNINKKNILSCAFYFFELLLGHDRNERIASYFFNMTQIQRDVCNIYILTMSISVKD